MPGLISPQEKTLEAMLFASPDAVPLEKLAETLNIDIPMARGLLERMGQTYRQDNAGIQLQELDGSYRLCTNPAYYPAVRALLQRKARAMLSQATLETLSIIAFKQPITKGGVEEIRGINSDNSVNKLVECGLVEEKGRLENAPRKPLLFGTSEEFLLFYDIKNVEDFLAKIEPAQLDEGDGHFQQLTLDMVAETVPEPDAILDAIPQTDLQEEPT